MLRFIFVIAAYLNLSYLFLTFQPKFFKTFKILQKSRPLDCKLFTQSHAPKKSYEETVLLPNEVYPYKFKPLDIENTKNLNLSKYSCTPISFGYSIAEGKKLFPDYEYPSCSSVTGVFQSLLSINETSNNLSMTCPNDKKGFYFQGPLFVKNLMMRESVKHFKLHEYKIQNTFGPSSFGLGFCSNSTISKNPSSEKFAVYDINPKEIQHADMTPIFDQHLFEKNLKTLNGTKPKIIFLLTLDSLSRRHFYRKLPKLVKFLNESENLLPSLAVYDFLLHGTFGADSVHNQIPIFGGADYMKKIYECRGRDKLGESSMWFQLKKKGFLTLMGFDDCDKWFPKLLGEEVNIDYVIRQFYCLVDVYGKVKTEKVNIEQRCLGPYQTHAYLLNYTLKIVEMYKKNNIWIYLHLNAGHERTGQHAATLDADVTYFLQRFFETTKNVSDVFMFLGADHGMRYGDWYNSIEAYKETTLPSMFVISDKSLLEQFNYSHHSLEENSKRLTSKLDIRKTIFSLVGIQEECPQSVDWLSQIANYSRNCKDLKSDMLFCPCSNFILMKKYNKIIKSVLKLIREKTEEAMNKISFNFPLYSQGLYCDRVNLDRLIDAYHWSVNRTHEVFKLEFGTSAFKQFKLQVNVLISLAYYFSKNSHYKFGSFDLVAKGYKYKASVRAA